MIELDPRKLTLDAVDIWNQEPTWDQAYHAPDSGTSPRKVILRVAFREVFESGVVAL